MRALAALVLVAAVTAAAPSAGMKDGDLEFSLSRITYKLKPGNRGAEDVPATEVCVSPAVLETIDKSKISLGIKKENEDRFTNYAADSKNEANTCADFLIDKPAEGNVLYSLGVSTDETATLDQSARVKFFFKVLEDQTQLTCDEQSFKITTLTSEDDKQNCLNKETVQVGGNCYESADVPVTTEGCVKPNGDDFEYCQSEAKVEVYKQDEDDNGNKVSSPAESLNYNGMLTIDVGNNGKEVILILKDNGDTTKMTGLTVSGTGTVDVSATFQRSAAAYTVCPVMPEFTAYTIRDLYILGGLVPEGDPEGSKNYYEFGLKYVNEDSKEFVASTSGQKEIIIDCSNLNAGPNTRCYGFVEQEGDKPLTVTYNDDDKTNKIIVASGEIKNLQ